jgi:hypothetical protein
LFLFLKRLFKDNGRFYLTPATFRTIALKLLISLALLLFSTTSECQLKLYTLGELADASVLLLQTSKGGKDGTGTFIQDKDNYFIVTAAHVIKNFDIGTVLVLHLPGDKPQMIDLVVVTKGSVKW